MIGLAILTTSAALLHATLAAEAEEHASDEQGTVMGPVAFLWPDDRAWNADQDNVGPCGSATSPGERTEFPLGALIWSSMRGSLADCSDREGLCGPFHCR